MAWKKTQETKRCQSFMKLSWNWHFLTIFSPNFCQNSSRGEVHKNFAKFCQTFINLLFLAFCCSKFCQTFVNLLLLHIVVEKLTNFCQKSEKLQIKKVDQMLPNVCEFCFNILLIMNWTVPKYCQCFERDDMQDVKKLSPKFRDIYCEQLSHTIL